MLTYYDSAENVIITFYRAMSIVIEHGCSMKEFLEVKGKQDSYDAQEVLYYLGIK